MAKATSFEDLLTPTLRSDDYPHFIKIIISDYYYLC